VDTSRDVEVIAEIAQGFEGRPEQARLLIAAAASAGADAVKFQLVYADELATPDYVHFPLFTTLEMADDAWQRLANQARDANIRLQFDVFGPRSLVLATSLGADAVKLHPTDLANTALLDAVAASAAPRVILGVGGTWASEVDVALQILAGKPVVLLAGFQAYPTPDDTNQIARLPRLLERVRAIHANVAVGFADHSDPTTPLRYALSASAVGAGATVIEKHLTLGRGMKLEDHESALNPDEFLEFTRVIRACAAAQGTVVEADDFGMSDAERTYRSVIRRHVVAARTLSIGTVIVPTDLLLRRTSAAAPLTDLHAAYGRTLVREVAAGRALSAADLPAPAPATREES
jgi:sialic acid synthase SpsE